MGKKLGILILMLLCVWGVIFYNGKKDEEYFGEKVDIFPA